MYTTNDNMVFNDRDGNQYRILFCSDKLYDDFEKGKITFSELALNDDVIIELVKGDNDYILRGSYA